MPATISPSRYWIAAVTLVAVIGTPFDAAGQRRADWKALRNEMVDDEVVAAGVSDPRVIAAMRATKRHEFVPLADRRRAYFDMALPIGASQTISPPFVVAYMTEQLEPQPTDTVLEIGTGSGYQAAVLSPLVKDVYSIEIVPSLGKRAARTLNRLGYENVHTRVGDGYQGWPATRRRRSTRSSSPAAPRTRRRNSLSSLPKAGGWSSRWASASSRTSA
ncbi:MAG: protein-L-isoaspartate O-methyltransferase [Planctomycetota bacterium]